MAGFPLMAIGAGIGQGAEAIQRQRQMALEAALRQLQIKQYQDEQQAAGSLFPAALSGALDAPQMSPLGTGGLGGAGGAAFGGGADMLPGGISSGLSNLSDPRGLVPYIRETAAKYKVDPDTAVRVFGSEGLASPVGDKGTSFGAPQLHVGGGLGDEFQKETGLDPRDWKNNERAMIDWSLRNVARTGWGPYHGAARIGVGPRQGIDDGAGGGGGVTPDPLHQEAQQGASAAASLIPPDARGRASIQAMAQAIEKAMPGADPYVKMMALERGMKLVSPYEQRIWEAWKMQHGETLDRAKEDRDRQFKIDQQERSQDFQRSQSEGLAKGHTQVTLPSGATVTGIAGQPDSWTTMTGEKLTPQQLQELNQGQISKFGGRQVAPLQALPPLQPDAQWEGKPNKPPPPEMTGGLMIDPGVWSGAVAYVKSGGQIKPPFSIWGDNPTARAFNQALPAAEAALGTTPEQRTALAAAYRGQVAAGGVVGRVSGATAQGAYEIDKFAPLIEEFSARINKTDFPTVNSIFNAVAQHTGNPDIVQLNSYIQSAKNAYVQIMTRSGRPTVYANRRADELINPNMGIDQIPAALDAMSNEAAIALSSADQAMRHVTGQGETAPAARRVRPGQATAPVANDPPKEAVDYLRQNDTPEMRQAFDQKYGAGAAAKALGQ